MDNVVSFGDGKPIRAVPYVEPDVAVEAVDDTVPSVISVLKILMAEAESGKIRGFAGVLGLRGDGIGYTISGEMQPFPMIGGIEFVKSELIAMARGDGEDD